MRILFITSTRIGDAVLSSGALAYLVKEYPEARFTIACGPVAAPLFADLPRLERLIVVRKQKRGLHWLTLWRETAGTYWHMVVDLRASAMAWLLPTLRRKILSPFKSDDHRVARFSRVMGAGHILPPHIFTSDATRARATALLPQNGAALALGPTANWFGKQWPIERFAELAQRLTAPGGAFAHAPILILGGPGERDMAEALLASLPPERVQAYFGDLDLLTVSACLARCRLFVGNDSGLMHLSAATGIATVGLFGPSRDELYAPWGPNGHVVRGLTWQQLTSENFDRFARRSYMDSITVDMVMDSVNHALGSTAPQLMVTT